MEEKDILKAYIKDLESKKTFTEEDNSKYLALAKDGDSLAKNLLLEGNLYIVPVRVSEFIESGVSALDMIQEGNMALVEAVNSLIEDDDNTPSNITEYFSEIIDIALNGFVADESREAMAANNLKNEANRLLDITTKFEEEHNREATLDELAELMGMDKDEVENILTISYNAMKLAEDK